MKKWLALAYPNVVFIGVTPFRETIERFRHSDAGYVFLLLQRSRQIHNLQRAGQKMWTETVQQSSATGIIEFNLLKRYNLPSQERYLTAWMEDSVSINQKNLKERMEASESRSQPLLAPVRNNHTMFDWLIDRLSYWMIDWLIDWWIDCLTEWSMNWLIDWLYLRIKFRCSFP